MEVFLANGGPDHISLQRKSGPMKSSSCVLISFLLVTLTLQADEPKPAAEATTPHTYPERIQWWADARFGMFIHWGPVSLKGTEISWSRANTNPACPNHGVIPADVYDQSLQGVQPDEV